MRVFHDPCAKVLPQCGKPPDGWRGVTDVQAGEPAHPRLTAVPEAETISMLLITS